MNTINVMRQAIEALEYHTAQTRPVLGTEAAITALRAELERLDAVEPVAWGVAYTSRKPTDLFFYEDEARIEAEHCGGTARVVPLYTAPIAPAIPALTCQDMALRCPSWNDIDGAARWAYALAAERAGVQIKDTLQELADDAKQIGLEY